MKLIRLFVLSFIILCFNEARAQDSIRTGQWISANFHYGMILPVYTEGMDVLIQGHIPAVEIDYLDKPDGNHPWQIDYHYAETGVAFFYAWLGNPTQLGNEIGAYPFINFHLQRSAREKLYLRAGLGLAYLPVIFNQETDHKNILIGTHVNTIINLRLTYHYYLSNNLRIETGFGITHCSNGSFSTPNLGINIISLNTGLSYCLNERKVQTISPQPDTSNHKKLIHEFYISGGTMEIEPPGGKRYGAVTLNYTAYKNLNRKNKIGAGIDLFYNSANLETLALDSVHVKSKLENIQIGIKFGYELVIGRIALPYEIGAYLYTKSLGHGYEYNRLGIRYYINPHFIANISLLAHFASADFVEWGFGYRL